MSEITRLHINLSRETADAIQRIAADHGISITEVIRRSISVYAFVSEETKAGHIITAGKGRKRRELLLR